MGRKWEPFDVHAELVKIFMAEGVCPWCGGELTTDERSQERICQQCGTCKIKLESCMMSKNNWSVNWERW